MLTSLKSPLTLAVLSSLLTLGALPAARAQIVQNGDFAAAVVTDGSGSATSIPGWTIVNNFVGVNPANGGASPFADNGAPPKNFAGTGPATVGFLLSQGLTTPATISQTLSGLTLGSTYTLSFYDNASYVGYPQLPTLTVSVGGLPVFAQTLTQVNGYGSTDQPYRFVSTSFVATGGSEALTFSSLSPALSTNTISLFTDVVVKPAAAPEPSSIAGLATGACVLAGLLLSRKRKSVLALS